MALIDDERAILAICFRAEPPEDALQALGDRRGWLLYREMVRERLLREIRAALPRSCALVGARVLEATFTAQLEREPPRTRFFREVVGSFARCAEGLWSQDGALHPACLDLLRYELALFEVADLEAQPALPPREFDFDRRPLASPALRLLRVSHAVHQGAELVPGPAQLCVHRASDADPPRTWTLTEPTFELMAALMQGEQTVSDVLRCLAARRGARLDAAYVDAACAALAQFLEVGMLLGSR